MTPRFEEVIAWAWHGPSPGSAAHLQARLLLLDSLGCAIAGLRHPRVAAFAQALSAWHPGHVRLPGIGASLSRGAAAAVLATATCWDEANDGLARAHGRPGLPVAPLALTSGAPLRDMLAAYALGYEVAARAGEAWRIRPGMHVDGSWHALGAAAAAARLAGLDADGAARAVRLAACQVPFSLYAPIAAGLDGRNSYPAHAVLLGVAAASAAASGMDAPPGGFAEARRLALNLSDDAACAPVGQWLIEAGYAKPYAGVRHAHYAAAAAIALRPAVTARLPAIRAITVETYAEALTYAGLRAPATAIAAQFSLSWAVAAALRLGDLGPEAYADEALNDAELRRLEAVITLREDAALTAAGRRGARVTLEVAGERFAHEVDGVAGDPGRPMTQAEIRAKFLRFSAPLLGDAKAEAVADGLIGGETFVSPFA